MAGMFHPCPCAAFDAHMPLHQMEMSLTALKEGCDAKPHWWLYIYMYDDMYRWLCLRMVFLKFIHVEIHTFLKCFL